jgi:hypothetical protein
LYQQLDKAGLKKGKLDKKQSELAKKLLKKAPGAIKDGLDALDDDYDADQPEHEVPKISIMRFLFGPEAPSVRIVLTAIGVVFLGLGYLSSVVLGEAGFGMFGNALILLVGAALGAGLHDLTFSPEYFWDYEPTPGILTPVIFGLATLIGACFARKYAQERMDEVHAAEAANLRRRAASQLAARRTSFGE